MLFRCLLLIAQMLTGIYSTAATPIYRLYCMFTDTYIYSKYSVNQVKLNGIGNNQEPNTLNLFVCVCLRQGVRENWFKRSGC